MVIDLDRVKNRRCLLMSEAALTSRVHYDNHTKLLHLSGNSSTFLGCARLRQDPDVAGQISGLRSSPGSRVLQYVAKLGVRRYEIGSHSGSRLYFIKKCHVVPPPPPPGNIVSFTNTCMSPFISNLLLSDHRSFACRRQVKRTKWANWMGTHHFDVY